MKKPVPEFMNSVVTSTRDAFCDMLQNPSLWNETIIRETLNRGEGHPFDIGDVQSIVKDYLAVLSENIRTGTDL